VVAKQAPWPSSVAAYQPPGGATTNQEVTLDAILEFADARSPVLTVARSTRSRAEAARVAASPLLPANPQLNVGAGPRIGVDGTGVDFEAGISQRFEIAGERGLRREAADRFSELTDAEVEQIRWVVHCDVHATFHEVLVARERERLAAQVLVFQEELFHVVERQVAAGETAPLTLRLAQAEVAQARQAAVATAQGHLAARLRLARLSGWPAATPPEPIGVLDVPRDPPPFEELVASARKGIPLLRARAAVKEAEARAVLADREIWPQPTLGLQYQREGTKGPEGPSDILLGTLSFPIPSFQTNQGDRARTRSDLGIAKAELDAADALLSGVVAQARSEMVSAAQRVLSYGTEVLPRFEENLTLLRRTFELGDIDLLALLVGRERFLRIQSDALDAHRDYFVALAALERAVGADLWRDEHHEERPK
jgi:cobalt-zinc-cadmium efflux system outer membrane protein